MRPGRQVRNPRCSTRLVSPIDTQPRHEPAVSETTLAKLEIWIFGGPPIEGGLVVSPGLAVSASQLAWSSGACRPATGSSTVPGHIRWLNR